MKTLNPIFWSMGALAVGLSVLTACSKPNDASDKNFTKTINERFKTHCIEYFPSIGITGSGIDIKETGTPVFVAFEANDKDRIARLDILVKAGLLEQKDDKAQLNSYFSFSGGPNPVVDVKVYTLTAAGKKAVVPGGDAGGVHPFCAGYYEVDEIVDFTEPPEKSQSQSFGFPPMTVVRYTYELDKLAGWAKDPAIKSVLEEQGKLKSGEGEIALARTNKGWRELR